MKIAIMGSLATMLLAHSARADQCQWLTNPDVARRAVRELAAHPEIIAFCEPCGDVAPGAPHPVSRVTLEHPFHGTTSIALDGESVDLAYIYVRTSARRDAEASERQYRNLAALAGCETSGVSPSLRVIAATPTGVLISADRPARATLAEPSAAAPPPVEPPSASPLPPVVAAPAVRRAPSSSAWLVVIAMLGAVVCWLVARRRPVHVPRATRLHLDLFDQ